ncbi:hypothetical protein A6O26_20755 [Acidithiobacillus thiooxidans]|uniref:hypothetical protein n=1 Tax=Acidithiobacillus thiooxidans TaxID=930 RepID=UPI0008264563|nr:hypothetical protein [Acidithiobacillus thiooxidans]OCX76816.1 hypothetical protein A6O26_20755 [Acidithiobacillus thiooxidans]
MAIMTQEKKATIATELKKFMPKDWKYSLSVRHHSEIVMIIRSAPIDLLEASGLAGDKECRVSRYFRPAELFPKNPELAELFGKIKDALNLGNYDKSDVMTDYFDVGHYVDLRIGKWDKPFQIAA